MSIEVPVQVRVVGGGDAPDGWAVKATPTGTGGTATASAATPNLALDAGGYAVSFTTEPAGHLAHTETTPVRVTDINGVWSATPNPIVLDVDPTATVAVSVIGPDTAASVASWKVGVAGTRSDGRKVEKDLTHEQPSVELAPGTYTFTLGEVAATHQGLEGDLAKKEVVVSAAGGTATAKVGDATVSADAPVRWIVSAVPAAEEAATEDHATGPLFTVVSAIAALLLVGYWVGTLVLEPDADGISETFMWGIVLTGAALALIGGVLLLLCFAKTEKRLVWLEPWPALSLVVMGAVVALVGAALNGPRDLDSAERFAMGTGGVALVAFVIGLTRFDTVKAAASLPVIVLFIGAVVWPQTIGADGTSSSPVVDDDLRKQLIYWMSGFLGLTAVGETVQQVSRNRAESRVATAKAESLGAAAAAAAGSGARDGVGGWTIQNPPVAPAAAGRGGSSVPGSGAASVEAAAAALARIGLSKSEGDLRQRRRGR